MWSRYVLVAVALWVGLGSPASAIDLTGVWTDARDYPCTVTTPESTRRSLHSAPPLFVAQTEGLLAINWPSDTHVWSGRVFDARGVPRGVAHYCGAGTDRAIMQILSASTFPVNNKGVSGRMIVEYRNVNTSNYFECKRIEFERVELENPNPAPCP